MLCFSGSTKGYCNSTKDLICKEQDLDNALASFLHLIIQDHSLPGDNCGVGSQVLRCSPALCLNLYTYERCVGALLHISSFISLITGYVMFAESWIKTQHVPRTCASKKESSLILLLSGSGDRNYNKLLTNV